MKLIFNDQTFSFELLRTMGYAAFGGAEWGNACLLPTSLGKILPRSFHHSSWQRSEGSRIFYASIDEKRAAANRRRLESSPEGLTKSRVYGSVLHGLRATRRTGLQIAILAVCEPFFAAR